MPGKSKPVAFGDITGVIDSELFTPLNGDARIYLQVSPGRQNKYGGVDRGADARRPVQDRRRSMHGLKKKQDLDLRKTILGSPSLPG